MIQAENIHKKIGNLQVLDGVSFEVDTTKTHVILGPSGCGKTTLIKILTGLMEADKGSVNIQGRPGIVFQEPRLLPWKTLEENLKVVKKLNKENSGDADTVLKSIGMYDSRKKYPDEISGGMKQRISFGRALMTSPDVLILDEPFNSLDFKAKAELQDIIKNKIEDRKIKTVYVTHDLESALKVGDKIISLSEKPSSILDIFDANNFNSVEEFRERISQIYL